MGCDTSVLVDSVEDILSSQKKKEKLRHGRDRQHIKMGQKGINIPSSDEDYSSSFSMIVGSEVQDIIINKKTLVVVGKDSMKIFLPEYVKKQSRELFEFHYLNELVKLWDENEGVKSKSLKDAEVVLREQTNPEWIRTDVKKLSDDVLCVKYRSRTNTSVLSLFLSISKKKVFHELFLKQHVNFNSTQLNPNRNSNVSYVEHVISTNEDHFGILGWRPFVEGIEDTIMFSEKIQVFPFQKCSESSVEREFVSKMEISDLLRFKSTSKFTFFVRWAKNSLVADVFDFSKKEDFVVGKECFLCRNESTSGAFKYTPHIVWEDTLVVMRQNIDKSEEKDFGDLRDGWLLRVFRFSKGEMVCVMEKSVRPTELATRVPWEKTRSFYMRKMEVHYTGFRKECFAEIEQKLLSKPGCRDMHKCDVCLVNTVTMERTSLKDHFSSHRVCVLDRGSVVVGFGRTNPHFVFENRRRHEPKFKGDPFSSEFSKCVIYLVNVKSGRKKRLGSWFCENAVVLNDVLNSSQVSPFRALTEDSLLFFDTRKQTIYRLNINGDSTLVVESKKSMASYITGDGIEKMKFMAKMLRRNMVVVKDGKSAIVIEHSFFFSFRIYMVMVWSKLDLPFDILRYEIFKYFNESWCQGFEWRRGIQKENK